MNTGYLQEMNTANNEWLVKSPEGVLTIMNDLVLTTEQAQMLGAISIPDMPEADAARPWTLANWEEWNLLENNGTMHPSRPFSKEYGFEPYLLEELYAGATHSSEDDHMHNTGAHGGEDYLEELRFGSRIKRAFKKAAPVFKKIGKGIVTVAKNPLVQKVALTAAEAALAAQLQELCSGSACNQMHYLEELRTISFTDAQIAAAEAKADAADVALDARINANAKLTDAMKAKLVAAADAGDAKLHAWLEAHRAATTMMI
jgi:hypothetical protein